MNKHALLSVVALLGSAMPEVNAVEAPPSRRSGFRRSITWDPQAKERAELRKAGEFVAADGQRYPIGPCGYVPRSAQVDPTRRTR